MRNNIFVRTYRLLPRQFRETVYNAFLGRLLSYKRNPALYHQNKRLKKVFYKYIACFKDGVGLEVGGPSFLFSALGLIPLYPICKTIDGCNYSSSTVWEGMIKDHIYRFKEQRLGIQYIGEATEIPMVVGTKKYDFVISSNCLEHVANPIKALKAWESVIKANGILLLIVPNKKKNFDHKRPDTTFEHILQDYENDVTEEDFTHYSEIIAMHDLSLDQNIENMDVFNKRCLNNFDNRCFHHHVFQQDCLISLFQYLNLDILFVSSTDVDHIILGKKR